MTIVQARNKARTLKTIGFLISLAFFVLLFLSVVKMLYEGALTQIDTGNPILPELFLKITKFIEAIYNATPFIDVIWPHLPVLNIQGHFLPSLYGFAVLLAGFWVGVALWDMGNKTAGEIKEVEKELRKESMLNSARPGVQRSYEEMRHIVQVDTPSFLKSIRDTLFLPVVGGLIVAFFTFWFGWN